MSNNGGAKPGAGQKHALKADPKSQDRLAAALQFSAGRAVIDRLLSDGQALGPEIMLEAARFDFKRARRYANMADEMMPIEERDRLENLASTLYAQAATHASKASPYMHSKLASIEHLGGGASAPVQAGVSLAVMLMLEQLAESKRKGALIIENPPQGAEPMPIAPALPTPTILEDVVERIHQQLAENIDRVAEVVAEVTKDEEDGGAA